MGIKNNNWAIAFIVLASIVLLGVIIYWHYEEIQKIQQTYFRYGYNNATINDLRDTCTDVFQNQGKGVITICNQLINESGIKK